MSPNATVLDNVAPQIPAPLDQNSSIRRQVPEALAGPMGAGVQPPDALDAIAAKYGAEDYASPDYDAIAVKHGAVDYTQPDYDKIAAKYGAMDAGSAAERLMNPPGVPAPPLPHELQPQPPVLMAREAGMRIAANPPPVPKPQLPQELKTPAQVAAEAPERIDPRTGLRYKQLPMGQHILDIPYRAYQDVSQGVEQLAAPAQQFGHEVVQRAAGSRTQSPTLLSPENRLAAAGGALKIGSGLMEAATPALIAGGIAAPVRTAATLGAALLTQEYTKAAIDDLAAQTGIHVVPEYRDLAAGILGIFAAHGVGLSMAPPEVQALVEGLGGPSADPAVNADRIEKITRLATHPATPPAEAAAARGMLRKMGINIPEDVPAPPVAPQAQPAPPPPQPIPNTKDFIKAHNAWKGATAKAAAKFMEENPDVTWDQAMAVVDGVAGPEPRIHDFKPTPTPPPAPEPPAPPPPPPEPVKPTPVQKVGPETPNPPTAALPTEPESPETIALQVSQLTEGTRKVVMFPQGQGQPLSPPPGLALANDGLGNTYLFRPDLISRSAIRTAARNNTLPEILGGPMGMGAPDKTALQGEPVAVVGHAPDGTEAQTTVTDGANLPQTVSATHAVTPPGGTVTVMPPEQVLAGRQPVSGEVIQPQSQVDVPQAPPLPEQPVPAAQTAVTQGGIGGTNNTGNQSAGISPVAGIQTPSGVAGQPLPEGNQPEPVRGLQQPGGGEHGAGEPERVGISSRVSAGGTRRITGSADIPLTPAGEAQAEDMTAKAVKPFDVIIAPPSARGRETAGKFGSFTELPSLDGWARGIHEGQPADAVQDEMSRLIMNPDEVPPGVSPLSGQPGQSWNQMAKPLFKDVAGVLRQLKGGQRALIVTSGGNLQAIDAWGKAGYPADGNFDHSSIAKQPYWSVTGKMFRLEDDGLKEVKDNSEPGLHFAEHGKTAFNNDGGKAPETVKPESLLTRDKAMKLTPKQRQQAERERMRAIYKPGNVITGYGGQIDRVLDFKEMPGGGFNVTVQESKADGTPVAGSRPRLHSTWPEKDAKVLGTVEEKAMHPAITAAEALTAEVNKVDPSSLDETQAKALIDRNYKVQEALYDASEKLSKEIIPQTSGGFPVAGRDLDQAIKPIIARHDALKSMREGAERAAHNKDIAERDDKAAFERATTVRPKNPIPADVDDRKDDAVPSGYKVIRYASGNRLLRANGLHSIVQSFDTREWKWNDEFTGPAQKASDRFAEYSKNPITQEALDQETAYINGPWRAERSVGKAPIRPPATVTTTKGPAITSDTDFAAAETELAKSESDLTAARRRYKRLDDLYTQVKDRTAREMSEVDLQEFSRSKPSEVEDDVRKQLILAGRKYETARDAHDQILANTAEVNPLLVRQQDDQRMPIAIPEDPEADSTLKASIGEVVDEIKQLQRLGEEGDPDFDPREHIDDLKRNLKYLDEDIRDLEHADPHVMEEAKSSAEVARKVIASAESYNPPQPPVEPSAQRFREIDRELKIIYKSPIYAADTVEGRRLRDQALELSDEQQIHRPAAVAEAQAEIDRESAARKAKEVSVSVDTPETTRMVAAIRRIIDAHENGQEISQSDRVAYADYVRSLGNIAVNKGLDPKHYLKSAGIVEKYWNAIPREEPKAAPQSYDEKSAAAMPEQEPRPQDILPKSGTVTIPNDIAKQIIPILKRVAVGRGGTIPILGNVSIVTQDGKTKITATDLDQAVTFTLPGKIASGDHAYTVPLSALEGAIKIKTKDPLKITAEPGTVPSAPGKATLTSGSAESSAATIDIGQFPLAPQATDPIGKISVASLLDAIKKTLPAVSTEESRFTLNGALLEIKDGRATIVATDGHRLSMQSFDAPEIEGDHRFLIPRRTMETVYKLFAKEPGSLVMKQLFGPENKGQRTHYITFEKPDGSAILLARELTGNFPDYQRIIPENFTHKAIIDRGSLLDLMKRAVAMKERTNNIHLSFRPDSVIGLKQTEDATVKGNAPASLERFSGMENPRAHLNAKYLADFLSSIDSDKVEMELQGAEQKYKEGANPKPLPPSKTMKEAFVVRPAGDANHTTIIMPMRDDAPEWDDGYQGVAHRPRVTITNDLNATTLREAFRSASAQYDRPSRIASTHGHVYLNQGAAALIERVLTEAGEYVQPFDGLTMPARISEILVDALNKATTSRNTALAIGAAKILPEIKKSIQDHPVVTLVDAGADRSVQDIQKTRREEGFHRAQIATGIFRLNDAAVRALMSDPVISQVVERLRNVGRAASDNAALLEMGALLGTGQGYDFGLNAKESSEAFRKYIDTVILNHGPKVGVILKMATPQVRKELGHDYVTARWNGKDTTGAKRDGGNQGSSPVARPFGSRTGSGGRNMEAVTGRERIPANREQGTSADYPQATGTVNAGRELLRPGIRDEPEGSGVLSRPETGARTSDDNAIPKSDEAGAGLRSAVETEDERAGVKRLSSEAGTSPAFDSFVKLLNDIVARSPEEPKEPTGKRHYGHGGSFLKRWLLPGRNLAEVRAANRDVYNAAVLAGSASSQASTIMHNALPQITKALKGTGIDIHQLFSAYQESRLRAIEQRYKEWGDAVNSMSDEQVQDAVQRSFPNGQSTLLEMLNNLDEKLDILDLGQTAAAMASRGEWGGVRALAFGAFYDAADSVTHTMDDAQFQKIADIIRNNPGGVTADRLYGDLFEKEVAESHARHDGIFAEDLGPLGRYFPLMVENKNANKLTAGRRLPFRSPRNMNNQMAMGMSSRGYITDLPTLAKHLGTSMRASGKANLLKTISEHGWSSPEPRDWNGLFEGPDGITYVGHREEAKAGRTIIVDGKTVHTATSNVVMPLFLYEGLEPMLAQKALAPEDVVKGLRWLNLISTKFLPFELAYHSNGMFGALYGNTPFVSGTPIEKALTLPIVKAFYLRYKMFDTDPSTPENAAKLIRIAKIGALPARSHTVTYNKKIAEETGAKQEPKYTWGPMLYGPNGFDARARIMMYDMAVASDPNMSDADLGDFINQIGQYTPEFQGMVERGLKRWQMGPFATAGMTRIVNGFHAATGTGPTPTPGSPAWNIAKNIAYGMLGTLAIYILGYKALTGKWPNKDPRFKMWSVAVGGDNHGWIDQFRHSKLGDLQWGNGPEVGYINTGGIIAPLIQRVTPKTAINRWMHHGSPEQIFNGFKADGLNLLAHPAMGPAARAGFVWATGKEPYVTDFADLQGKPSLELFPAIPGKLRSGVVGGVAPGFAGGYPTKHPGFGARTGAQFAAGLRELSSTAALLGEETGTLGEDDKKGSLAFRTVMGLAFPGMLSNASNPYAQENYLMQQKRSLSQLSLPDALKVYDAAAPNQKREMYREVKDKVYSAQQRPDQWNGETRALAKHYFNFQPRVPAALFPGAPGELLGNPRPIQ